MTGDRVTRIRRLRDGAGDDAMNDRVDRITRDPDVDGAADEEGTGRLNDEGQREVGEEEERPETNDDEQPEAIDGDTQPEAIDGDTQPEAIDGDSQTETVEDDGQPESLEKDEHSESIANEENQPETVGDVEAVTDDDRVQVLEFTLGDERFCLDVEYVEEVVENTDPTPIPNAPGYVEGVIDLRGHVTTVIDPKRLLNVNGDQASERRLVIVLDEDVVDMQGYVGWVVDDTHHVRYVSERDVRDAPTDDDRIAGVVKRDDEFVLWVTPASFVAD